MINLLGLEVKMITHPILPFVPLCYVLSTSCKGIG